MGKKDEYRFNLRFDETDEMHRLVVKYLNSCGHNKAKYIVRAFLAYWKMSGKSLLSYVFPEIDAEQLLPEAKQENDKKTAVVAKASDAGNDNGNAAYHWGLTCERVGKDRMNYVVQSLKEGKMVVEICEAYTITGSGSGHFIVLTGVTRDGYITIADCASRERTGKVYSVETIKSYGRDLSEGAFWIVGKK